MKKLPRGQHPMSAEAVKRLGLNSEEMMKVKRGKPEGRRGCGRVRRRA